MHSPGNGDRGFTGAPPPLYYNLLVTFTTALPVWELFGGRGCFSFTSHPWWPQELNKIVLSKYLLT